MGRNENGGPASFIIARKDALTDQQKEEIINYVEETMLGTRISGSADEICGYLKAHFANAADQVKLPTVCELRELLAEGFSIYIGDRSFMNLYAGYDLVSGLWEVLENETKDFVRVMTK